MIPAIIAAVGEGGAAAAGGEAAAGAGAGASAGGEVGSGMFGQMFGQFGQQAAQQGAQQAGQQTGGMLGQLKNQFQQLMNPLGGVKAQLQSFGQGIKQFVMNPLASTAGIINQFHMSLRTLEAPFKALEGLFAHAAEYVGKLSPIRVEYFNRAVADFQASIGQYLIPVLELGTKTFRVFGDVVAGLYSNAKPLIDAFRDAGGGIFDKFKEFLFTAADGFGQFVDSFKDFIPLIQNAGGWLKATLDLATKAMRFSGLDGSRFSGASTGMSYVATQTGSVESMINKIQQDAYGYGGSPAERTAEATEGMWEIMKDPTRAAATRIASDRGGTMVDAARAVAADPLGFLRREIVR